MILLPATDQSSNLLEFIVQQQAWIEALENEIIRLKKLNPEPDIKPETKPPDDSDPDDSPPGSDGNTGPEDSEDDDLHIRKSEVEKPDDTTRRQRSQPAWSGTTGSKSRENFLTLLHRLWSTCVSCSGWTGTGHERLSTYVAISLSAFFNLQLATAWALPAGQPEVSEPVSSSVSTLFLSQDPYTHALLRLQYDADNHSLEWQLLNNGYVISSLSQGLPEDVESVDMAAVYQGDLMVVAGKSVNGGWFLRAINSQGEFQWQHRGKGQIYDLAFGEDGQQVYIAGKSAHAPLFTVFSSNSGVIEFQLNSDVFFARDDLKTVFSQLVVTGKKEVVVAQHREKNGQFNPVFTRKLLSVSNATDENDDSSENRHFMNLEWLVGSITVVALIGLLYSGYRFAVHTWQKRNGRIERDQRQLEEQRTERNKFIKKLDVFDPLSSLVVLPGTPGDGSVLPVAGFVPARPYEGVTVTELQSGRMAVNNKQKLLHLFSYISKGYSNQVEKMLAHNPSLINTTDGEGVTALHLAASSGNYFMIEMLLIMGADTETATEQGYLPLHLAAMSGNAEVTSLIINWMPQLEPAVIAELFHLAAVYGHLDVLKLLHRRNMDKEIQMARVSGRQYLSQFRNGIYYATGFSAVRKETLPDGLGANGLSILHEAAMNNHLTMVKYILEGGLVPVNAEDMSGNTALHIAALNGNYHIVQYLLSQPGININAQNNLGYTPLHSALLKRNRQVVKLLAEHKMVDMTKTTLNGDTPLHFACEYDVSNALIGKGDVRARRKDGKTPLHLAAYPGNPIAITNLGLSLQEGASLNLDSKDNDGNTALHIAAMNEHSEFTTQLLVRHKRPKQAVQVLNKTDKKPSDLATPDGEVAKVLKEFETEASNQQYHLNGQAGSLHDEHENQKAPVAQPSKEPELHEKAAFGLTEEVVELLVNSKASISDRNSYGATALHVSSKAGQAEVARELIKNGANVNDVMSDGSSALHLASREGHTEVVKILVDGEAEVDIQNSEKNTPLHLAVERNQLSVVITLLEYHSKTDLGNENGDTALHLAVREKSIEIATRLLANSNASVDAQNSHGNSPLHEAAQDGNLKLTELLIRNGASTTVLNEQGKNPLVLAAKEGHIEVANIIRTAHQSETGGAKSQHKMSMLEPYELPESGTESEEHSVTAMEHTEPDPAPSPAPQQAQPGIVQDVTTSVQTTPKRQSASRKQIDKPGEMDTTESNL